MQDPSLLHRSPRGPGEMNHGPYRADHSLVLRETGERR